MRSRPALAELAAERWDEGNADFPPTSFQVSNLNAGTGANNVIPGELSALINFRYSTASTADELRARTEAILQRHGLDYALEWNLSGEPFLTPPGGVLRETVVAVCRDLCGSRARAESRASSSPGSSSASSTRPAPCRWPGSTAGARSGCCRPQRSCWWWSPCSRCCWVSVVDRGDVGLDVVAAATYVANWRFGLDAVDYFAAGTPSPVLHFWSLAVEEQFYLVWPWLLLLVTRAARRRGGSLTPSLLLGLALVAVPSLWWSAVQTESAPGWAYFSTFTRAWELAIGGALVMVLPMLARLPRAAAALLGWAGAAAVLWAVLTYSEAMPFPGTAALLPVLGTAALVAAGSRLPGAGVSLLLSAPHARADRRGVLLVVPLALAAAGVRRDPRRRSAAVVERALPVVALSYAVAVVTRRVVEEPFHHSRVLSLHPDRALRLGAACTAIGVLAGVVLAVPTALADRDAADPSSAPGAASLDVSADPGTAPHRAARRLPRPGPGSCPR